MQLFAPIWLEEIQSNKIYKKYSERNQKIEEGKVNTEENVTMENEVGEQEPSVEKDTEPEVGADIFGDKDNPQNVEEKESSRTESDQDC